MTKTLTLTSIILIVFANLSFAQLKNWKVQPRPPEDLHLIEPVKGKKASAICNTTNKVYRTFDFGKLWEPSGQLVEANYQDIHFLNKKIGLIVGSKGTMYKSTNGGFDWEPNNANFTRENLTSVFIISKKTAYTVSTENGKSIVYKTVDKFENWENVAELLDSITELKYFDKTLYACGSNSIYRIGEDTNEFEQVYQNKEVGHINDLIFNKKTKEIKAVSENGYIISCTPDGEWSEKQICITPLYSLAAITDKMWVAVGKTSNTSDNIRITVDGGKFWNKFRNSRPDFIFK